MHHRKKPTSRAYAFAAVAKAEGAELLYFSPGAVDMEKKEINGYVYKNGEWQSVISALPDVIYNTAGFWREKQNRIAEALHSIIPFTSYSVGSKETVYNNIMKYKEFSQYLVPSEMAESAGQFFILLEKYGDVVFKPTSGCRGRDVYFISRHSDRYNVLSGEQDVSCSFGEISDFVEGKLREEEYLVQPYINCRTKSGLSYDFRLHIQKNRRGEWTISKIYPRVAASGIVCNISAGGYTNSLTVFLKREFGDDYYDIQKYIEEFALQLAIHMDTIQKERYREELDELGIDIGLDAARNIRVYEVNWRPGYPPSMNLDLTVVQNTVGYAMLLASKNKAQAQGMK